MSDCPLYRPRAGEALCGLDLHKLAQRWPAGPVIYGRVCVCAGLTAACPYTKLRDETMKTAANNKRGLPPGRRQGRGNLSRVEAEASALVPRLAGHVVGYQASVLNHTVDGIDRDATPLMDLPGRD